MPVELTGGCLVSGLREGAPREAGNLRAWQPAGRQSGAAAISLRVVEVGPGRSPKLGGAACDEVLYVFEGAGTLLFEGGSRPIGTDTGFYVAPGAWFEIEASGAPFRAVTDTRSVWPMSARARLRKSIILSSRTPRVRTSAGRSSKGAARPETARRARPQIF